MMGWKDEITLFKIYRDCALGKVANQSYCGASVRNSEVTGLVFAADAVVLAELPEVLVVALKVLHEEAKLPLLKVSWTKTKV